MTGAAAVSPKSLGHGSVGRALAQVLDPVADVVTADVPGQLAGVIEQVAPGAAGVAGEQLGAYLAALLDG